MLPNLRRPPTGAALPALNSVLPSGSVKDAILRLAAGAQVVSFDIFDTLLIRRWADPDSVFRLLEDQIACDFGIAGFFEKRKGAEDLAGERKPEGDPTLAGIYDAMVELFGLTRSQALACMRLELEAEKAALIPRPEVVQAARELKTQGKRIIIVSDMYLDERQLRDLLQGCGIDFQDQLYVSSAVGQRKSREGALWDWVLEREGITADQILHVGDNIYSDIEMLHARGADKLVHVPRPIASFRSSPSGRNFLEGLSVGRWQDDLLVGLVANRARLAADRKAEAVSATTPFTSLEDFGYMVAGPIVLQFLAWAIEQARSNGIRRLEFVSRDGYLLKEIYDRIMSHQLNAGESPASGYLLLSRRATLFAAVQELSDIDYLLKDSFEGTIGELLRNRFGIETLDPYEAVLGKAVLQEGISARADGERIHELLRPCAELLCAQAKVEREALKAYLSTRLAEDVALVDSGYSATAQKALLRILGPPLHAIYLGAKIKANGVKDLGGTFSAWASEDVEGRRPDVVYQCMILEAILTSPAGQLVRFEQRDGRVRPVFTEPDHLPSEIEALAEMHRGVELFADDVLTATGGDLRFLEFDRTVVQRGLVCVGNLLWTVPSFIRDVMVVDDTYSNHPNVRVFDWLRPPRS